MEIILETYYILLPIVATALVGWVGFILKEQHKKEEDRDKRLKEKQKEDEVIQKANSRGTMLTLRYILNRYHTEYMVQGKMTYNQYKDWVELYDAYVALGGNSVAIEWNKDIEELEKCDFIEGRSLFENMVKSRLENKYNE